MLIGCKVVCLGCVGMVLADTLAALIWPRRSSTSALRELTCVAKHSTASIAGQPSSAPTVAGAGVVNVDARKDAKSKVASSLGSPSPAGIPVLFLEISGAAAHRAKDDAQRLGCRSDAPALDIGGLSR
ncbi:hypothetical protein PF006_g3457 [Phytophthora fragariae]|uniref:Uncharacterized protein n=1 Tax=Phytophthora fragariae TaxID=53985 RepID=A0A6A3EHW2_9STRA|nr:hypothetical protein PF009_g16805 [Phytophthora fragariae]KAE8982567.1 hypothetical protein PF011_g21561 [Phytophthora fragariae]KAE9152324.1 hypothetical protein PF006_g3457 [Phytophthora fragariae]KAE9198448.1 hypothetical protein PF004_g19537 [Phytophthora fragariae]